MKFTGIIVTLLSAAIAATGLAPVAATPLHEELMEMGGRARELGDRARAVGAPEWLNQKPDTSIEGLDGIKTQADEIVRSAISRLQKNLAPDDKAASIPLSGRSVVIAVSAALGDAALKDILASASGTDNVVVVLRGPMADEKLSAAVQRIHKLAMGFNPVPNINIDPTFFTRFGIQVAPEVLVFDDGVLRARARGLSVEDAVIRRIEAGEDGDLGVLGPVVDITEPDLIETIQAKAATLDLSGARDRAREGYWLRTDLIDLPTATASSRRLVDATVQLTRDIKTPRGEFVARAGTRINPFDRLSFTLRLIVIDARDQRQIAIAQEQLKRADNKRPMILLSGFDRERGWDGFRDLQSTLGLPVYKLTSEIRERVQLSSVPAVIEAAGDGRSFAVTVIAPGVQK